jgi:hypothetical protein
MKITVFPANPGEFDRPSPPREKPAEVMPDGRIDVFNKMLSEAKTVLSVEIEVRHGELYSWSMRQRPEESPYDICLSQVVQE